MIAAIILVGGYIIAVSWIGLPSPVDLLTGHLGPDFTCKSDNPVLLAPITSVADIESDRQSIYWLTRGNPGAVMKMFRINGKIQQLAEVQLEPYTILVDDNSVFWVEGSWQPETNFILKRIDKHGGDVVELWQTHGTIMQLNMDGNFLYWFNYEDQSVLRMSKEGGDPDVLLSGMDGLNNFSIMNGQVYLGNDDWVGILDQQAKMPRILITTDQLLQELHIGLRDERSVYFTGPVIQEYNHEIIFGFIVENNPGWISCTDNSVRIIGLSEVDGMPRIIMSVSGPLTNIGMIDKTLYSIGGCSGGQVINMDTGETSTIEIGYDAYNLALEKNLIFWTDHEGLKCIRSPK
jgi:hypothetical protein